MADKYLNITGFTYFYNRIKTIFASKAEIPTATSDLTNDGDGQSNFATEAYVAENGGKIDVIQLNGQTLPITNKTVNIVPKVDGLISSDTLTISMTEGEEYSDAGFTIVNDGTNSKLVVFFADPFGESTIMTAPSEELVQAMIDDSLSGITGIDFQVVTELPATGTHGVIYLVRKDGTSGDIYDEYIWLTPQGEIPHYEKIGTTDIDLSDYWAKADLVAITTAEIDTIVGA